MFSIKSMFRSAAYQKISKFHQAALVLQNIYLGRVVVPCPNIIINMPQTYEKLHCKAEPVQWLERSIGTGIQICCYFYIWITVNLFQNFKIIKILIAHNELVFFLVTKFLISEFVANKNNQMYYICTEYQNNFG